MTATVTFALFALVLAAPFLKSKRRESKQKSHRVSHASRLRRHRPDFEFLEVRTCPSASPTCMVMDLPSDQVTATRGSTSYDLDHGVVIGGGTVHGSTGQLGQLDWYVSIPDGWYPTSVQEVIFTNGDLYGGKGIHATVQHAGVVFSFIAGDTEYIVDRADCSVPGMYGDFWSASAPAYAASYSTPVLSLPSTLSGPFIVRVTAEANAVIDIRDIQLTVYAVPAVPPTWPADVAAAVANHPDSRYQVEEALAEAELHNNLQSQAAAALGAKTPDDSLLAALANRVLGTRVTPADTLTRLAGGLTLGRSFAQTVGNIARDILGEAFMQEADSVLRSINPAYNFDEALGEAILFNLGHQVLTSPNVPAKPSFPDLVHEFVKQALQQSVGDNVKSSNTSNSKFSSASRIGDAALEFLAKHAVYANHQKDETISAAGAQFQVIDVLDDATSGAYALFLESLSTPGERLVVFRGTEVTDPLDVAADLDSRGIGFSQFLVIRSTVLRWSRDAARTGKHLTLAGYSLGGALAQLLTVYLEHTGQHLTAEIDFNSPGIQSAAAFIPGRVDRVRHYQTAGDLVGRAGKAFLPGEVVLATTPLSFMPSMATPLTTITDPMRLLNLHLADVLGSNDKALDGVILRVMPLSDWVRLDPTPFAINPIQIPLSLLASAPSVEAAREMISSLAGTLIDLSHRGGTVALPTSLRGFSTVDSLAAALSEAAAEAASNALAQYTLGGWLDNSLRDLGLGKDLSGFGTELVLQTGTPLLNTAIAEVLSSSGISQAAAVVAAPVVEDFRAAIGIAKSTAFYQQLIHLDPLLTLTTGITHLLLPNPQNELQRVISRIVWTGEPLSSAALTLVTEIFGWNADRQAAKARRLAQSTARDRLITAYFKAFFESVLDQSDPRTQSLVAQAQADLDDPDSRNRGDRQFAMSLQARSIIADEILAGKMLIPSGAALPYVGPGKEEDGIRIAQNILFSVVVAAMDDALRHLAGKSFDDIWNAYSGAAPTGSTMPAAQAFLAELLNARIFVGSLAVAPPPQSGNLETSTDGSNYRIGYALPTDSDEVDQVIPISQNDDCLTLHPELAEKYAQLAAKTMDLANSLESLADSAKNGDPDPLRDAIEGGLRILVRDTAINSSPKSIWNDLETLGLEVTLRSVVGDRWPWSTAVRFGFIVKDAWEIAKLLEDIRKVSGDCPDVSQLPFYVPLPNTVLPLMGASVHLRDLVNAGDPVARLLPQSLSQVIEAVTGCDRAIKVLASSPSPARVSELTSLLNQLEQYMGVFYGASGLFANDAAGLKATSEFLSRRFPGRNLLFKATNHVEGVNPTSIAAALDDDETTALGASWDGSDGGHGGTITWVAQFAQPMIINAMTLDVTAMSYATGHYIRQREVSFTVEYQIAGHADWLPVPGASQSSGGGDGSSQVSFFGDLTNLNLRNVQAIRFVAHAYGNASGGEGRGGGSVQLYRWAVWGIPASV